MNSKKTLVCIVGPTASGKTAMAIEIATQFSTEIISADSRQFYKELSIGTAKPTSEELSAAPHHFISHKSIQDTYSAGDFSADALQKLKELFTFKDVVVMVGGSGMYIDAVCKGFDALPKVAESTRNQIIERYNKEGIVFLQHELSNKDPEYFNKADTQNPQRLMRALEVIYTTGKPFSQYLKRETTARDFQILTVGINWERSELYARINSRVDLMITAGLEAEARHYSAFRNNYALRSVGYSEFYDYFDGKQDLKTTIALIKQHTRNFAKRQLTWFKRDVETNWVTAQDKNTIFALINNTI